MCLTFCEFAFYIMCLNSGYTILFILSWDRYQSYSQCLDISLCQIYFKFSLSTHQNTKHSNLSNKSWWHVQKGCSVTQEILSSLFALRMNALMTPWGISPFLCLLSPEAEDQFWKSLPILFLKKGCCGWPLALPVFWAPAGSSGPFGWGMQPVRPSLWCKTRATHSTTFHFQQSLFAASTKYYVRRHLSSSKSESKTFIYIKFRKGIKKELLVLPRADCKTTSRTAID